MGAPSSWRTSVPLTLAADDCGGLRSVVPLAIQPAPEGSMENSSWPMVWPFNSMESLPLSAAKTPAAGDFLSDAATAKAAESAKTAAQARSEERNEDRELTRCINFSLGAQDATNQRVCRERGGEVALLSTVRSAAYRERDALRRRGKRSRGEEFPRRLARARRSYRRENRRAGRRVSAGHGVGGSSFRRERAGGQSWSCSGRAELRWENRARGRARRRREEIRGSLAGRTCRRRERESCLREVQRRGREQREADRLRAGERQARRDARKIARW